MSERVMNNAVRSFLGLSSDLSWKTARDRGLEVFADRCVSSMEWGERLCSDVATLSQCSVAMQQNGSHNWLQEPPEREEPPNAMDEDHTDDGRNKMRLRCSRSHVLLQDTECRSNDLELRASSFLSYPRQY
eukprot:5965258-Amphidinium_carterae.1